MRRASIPLPIPCEGITLPFELHTHIFIPFYPLYLEFINTVCILKYVSLHVKTYSIAAKLHSQKMLSPVVADVFIWLGCSLTLLGTLTVVIGCSFDVVFASSETTTSEGFYESLYFGKGHLYSIFLFFPDDRSLLCWDYFF